MATETHVRGDTLPLTLALPADDAVAVTLQVHTVTACVEVDGTIANGMASFDPTALNGLTPGRVYRTSARLTRAGGAVKTIDSFAVRIEAGCGSPPPAPSIHIIAANTLITPSTIILEAV